MNPEHLAITHVPWFRVSAKCVRGVDVFGVECRVFGVVDVFGVEFRAFGVDVVG